MTRVERRRTARHQVSLPISVTTQDGTQLQGQTINVSKDGVLLEASGRIDVRLTIDGREHRGWLVRAYQIQRGTFTYAIELEGDLDVTP